MCVSVKNNSGVKPAGQCGTWVKEPEGGLFTSPNYPNKYPPNTECVYILEGKYALKRKAALIKKKKGPSNLPAAVEAMLGLHLRVDSSVPSHEMHYFIKN